MTSPADKRDRTIVLIPSERAPKDPEWLLKAYAKEKLNALEMEEYLRFTYEQEHRMRLVRDCPSTKRTRTDMKREGVWAGVPTLVSVKEAANKYNNVRRNYTKCMRS